MHKLYIFLGAFTHKYVSYLSCESASFELTIVRNQNAEQNITQLWRFSVYFEHFGN